MSAKSLVAEPFEITVARGKAMEPTAPVTAEGVFVALAEYAIQHDRDDQVQATVLAIVEMSTPHLDDKKTADWWAELLQALVDIDRIGDCGPNWDEDGYDPEANRDEALDVLTGRR